MCRFVWKDRQTGEVQAEPFETEHLWFEIWCAGRLVVFMGPFCEVPSAECLRATARLLLPQADATVRKHHRLTPNKLGR